MLSDLFTLSAPSLSSSLVLFIAHSCPTLECIHAIAVPHSPHPYSAPLYLSPASIIRASFGYFLTAFTYIVPLPSHFVEVPGRNRRHHSR